MFTIRSSNSRFILTSLLVIFMLFGIASPHAVRAATLTVDTLLDENDGSCSDGDCSLRDAIQVAGVGDTITFSVTGTIVLTLDKIIIDKDLIIEGPGPMELVVSGNGSSSVFSITGDDISISGLMIGDGYAGWGGGIQTGDSNLTLTDIIFQDNHSINDGGGLNCNLSTLTLVDVIFSGNTAGRSGGGMSSHYCTQTLTDVDFTDNSSEGTAGDLDGGGGLYSHSGSAILTNITFSGNSADYRGGGMFNLYDNNNRLTNILFLNNQAYRDGGGMLIYVSNPTLNKVVFKDNLASEAGGGLFNHASNPILSNVTFSGNSTGGHGGAMFNLGSNPILTNVTISANSAYCGGGLFNKDTSTPAMKNTILAGNLGSIGTDCVGQINSYGYNLVQDMMYCGISGDETGNLYGVDPLLGPLADNGGYTLTHALFPGSPAMDSADGTDPFGNPITQDQRGVTRPQGPANDMGSFEILYPLHWSWLPFVLR